MVGLMLMNPMERNHRLNEQKLLTDGMYIGVVPLPSNRCVKLVDFFVALLLLNSITFLWGSHRSHQPLRTPIACSVASQSRPRAEKNSFELHQYPTTHYALWIQVPARNARKGYNFGGKSYLYLESQVPYF